MVQKKIEFRAIFNHKDKLNDKGKALVQIEAYHNRQRKYFSTGIFLKPAEWNEEAKTVTRKHPDHITVNNDIGKLIEQLRQAEYTLSRDLPNYDLNDLKKSFEKPAFTSFIVFAKSQIAAQTKSLSPATVDKQTRHVNKLEEFAGKDIKFSDLNYAFVDNFKNFLFNEDKDVNTIHDYFKRLGKFANMAIAHGYLKENNFQKLKPSIVRKIRKVITDTELRQIEKLKFTNG